MDLSKITKEDLVRADNIIVGIHKQAYFGRLAKHGYAPQGATQGAIEKEASALLQLGFDLTEMELMPGAVKQASDQSQLGNGPFAMAKQALDNYRQHVEVAPGFEFLGKSASAPGFEPAPAAPEFPQSLIDATYKAAAELAARPDVYAAAVIKRAYLEAVAAQQQQTAA